MTRRLGRADFYLVNAELWLARSNFSKCFRALRILINVAADAERRRTGFNGFPRTWEFYKYLRIVGSDMMTITYVFEVNISMKAAKLVFLTSML